MKIKKATQDEIKEAGSWPIWEKEVSEFSWEYNEPETFLVIEGKAEVTAEDESKVNFEKGDIVKMPKGLRCTWKITEDIKKYYKFG